MAFQFSKPEGEEFRMAVTSIFGVRAGRSALVIRFLTDRFVADYDPTIEDNYRKNVTVDGKSYSLDIIDTAGSEDYDYFRMRESWLKPCQGFLLVYDVKRRATFDGLDDVCEQLSQLKQMTKEELPIVICGNKCECSDDERQVPTAEGQSYADSYGYPFFETSAKTGHNVEEAFLTVVRFYSNHNNNVEEKRDKKPKTCVIC